MYDTIQTVLMNSNSENSKHIQLNSPFITHTHTSMQQPCMLFMVFTFASFHFFFFFTYNAFAILCCMCFNSASNHPHHCLNPQQRLQGSLADYEVQVVQQILLQSHLSHQMLVAMGMSCQGSHKGASLEQVLHNNVSSCHQQVAKQLLHWVCFQCHFLLGLPLC